MSVLAVSLVFCSLSYGQWTRNAKHEGNITAIALSPNYPSDSTIYMAVEGKGVFKSVDKGLSWVKFNEGLSTLNVTSIVIGDKGYGLDIFIGTKDEGIFTSMEGSDWFEYDWGLTNNHVTSLFISPDYQYDSTVFAGTYGGGVFKSTNGGGEWQSLNSPVSEIISVAVYFPGVTPAVIFAGTDSSGIICSTNGGDTWGYRNDGLPVGSSVRSIVLSPQFATDHIIFAGVSAASDPNLTGFYESVNEGFIWSDPCADITGTEVWSLSVSPVFTPSGGFVFIGSKSGLYRYEFGSSCLLAPDPALSSAWVLSQGISPGFDTSDQNIHFGLWDSGLHSSTNAGITSVQSYSTHNETNAISLKISPGFNVTDNLIVAASNDRGILRSLNGGLSWTTLNSYKYSGDPDGFLSIEISPEFEIGSDVTMFAGTAGRGLFKSTDGGNSWDQIYGIPLGANITAIAMSPTYRIDGIVFAGTRQYGLYKSPDGGNTWMHLSNPSMTGIFTLEFSPNFLTDNFLYTTGTNEGVIYRTNNMGDTWQQFSVDMTSAPYLISISFSPRFAFDGTMFLGANSTFGVYRSQNAGTEWININGIGLPSLINGVRSLEAIPGYGGVGPERLYIGTYGSGIYFTDNASSPSQDVIWYPFNTGLEDLNVNDIELSPKYNTNGGLLFAGTKTTGILYAKHNIGVNWTATGENNTSLTDKIQDLAVHPEKENILLAGTPEGAFISLNGGSSYIPYNRGLLSTGGISKFVSAVAFAPNTGNEPYPLAGTANGEIWRRSDLISFWIPVYTGSSAITEFSVTDSAIFATTAGNGVLKSTNQGLTWSPANIGLDSLYLNDISSLSLDGTSSPFPVDPDHSLLKTSVTSIVSPQGCCNGTDWIGTGGDGISLSLDGGDSWSTANGCGLGEDLSGANCQAVLATTGGWAVTGTDGLETVGFGMYRANDAIDTCWIRANYGLESTSLDIRDIVEADNGDILCGIYGETDGGVYLSADSGEHWCELNSGFDPSEYSVEDLLTTTSGTYYVGKAEDGSWSTTLTADPSPTVSSLNVTTGTAQGGTSVTVTGTGFKSGAIVEFGDIDASTTFVNSTTLTCTTPSYPAQTVDVSVRNADTRTGTLTDAFTYTDPATLLVLTMTKNTNGTDIDLSWSTDLTGDYKVYRDNSLSFDSMFRKCWDTSNTTMTDTDVLDDGNVWYYKVE